MDETNFTEMKSKMDQFVQLVFGDGDGRFGFIWEPKTGRIHVMRWNEETGDMISMSKKFQRLEAHSFAEFIHKASQAVGTISDHKAVDLFQGIAESMRRLLPSDKEDGAKEEENKNTS